MAACVAFACGAEGEVAPSEFVDGLDAVEVLDAPDPRHPPDRMVLIVVDTLRRDHLSVYGGAFATPHIDGLARDGQIFTNAFSSFHQTTMSMGSLFTGRTPSLESGDARAPLPWNGRNWCGLRRFALGAVDFCIPEGLPTLAEAFRDAGYWTAGVSTNALMFRPAGYDRGFDAWIEVGPLQSDQLRPGGGPDVDPSSRDAQAANAAVAALLDERPSERFFLYVHYMDVHDHGIHPVRGYRAAVQRADTGVGELLALLADRGLRDGATILLVSDHGERLRERHVVAGRPSHYGNPAFEEHLAIPLIVAPAHFGETDRFLRSDAIYGLIQQLAGISQVSVAEVEPDELFLSERRYQTYRQGRWKLYRERASGAVQLVDLESDPGETRDISARHPDIAARMLARIETLAGSLAAAPQGTIEPTGLTPDDKRRLQMLGYVE